MSLSISSIPTRLCILTYLRHTKAHQCCCILLGVWPSTTPLDLPKTLKKANAPSPSSYQIPVRLFDNQCIFSNVTRSHSMVSKWMLGMKMTILLYFKNQTHQKRELFYIYKPPKIFYKSLCSSSPSVTVSDCQN